MDNQVLVLDASYTPMGMERTQKGINYILKSKGYSIFDTEDLVVSANMVMFAPSIVVLTEPHAHKQRKHSRGLAWKKKRVLDRDKRTCAYCGEYANTIDHIKPKKLGGQNEWLNTVAACLPCNSKKGHKTLAESGMKLLFEPTIPTYMHKRLNVNDRQRAFLVENSLDHILG